MYAAVAVLFLLPSGLPTGGTTGIALLVNRLTGLSVSMFVLGFNIVMLVVGFIFLGKKFAFTTIVSTFTYPICLELFGQGLGSVIRMGTSTGGMDIPPLILNKYFKIPVSVSLNAFDICILLGQAILIPPEMLLYGVILVITYTTVLNKVLLLGGSKMEVKIISRNPELVIVSQEVGYGVVPVDAFDRKYREAVGRVCTKLAAYSSKVTRVVCGIGTVIKDA